MALENEENVESGFKDIPEAETKQKHNWVLLSLRVVAFLATTSATFVMALNKQTISVVVATIASTPITATLTAKFQHTPSFVFFVIANGIVSLYNLVMIAVDILGPDFDNKGLQLALIAIFDMVILALATSGDSAATSMAELGRNGNSHARWAKLCDKFEAYCNRGGAALIVSFISLIFLLIVAVMSITKLLKLNRI